MTALLFWKMFPAPLKWGLIGAVIAAVAFGAYLIDRNGYQRAMEACERRIAVQEAANREAARRAAERLMQQADQLSLDRLELNGVLDDLETEALADPDADRLCLGADSVGRLQSIR